MRPIVYKLKHQQWIAYVMQSTYFVSRTILQKYHIKWVFVIFLDWVAEFQFS